MPPTHDDSHLEPGRGKARIPASILSKTFELLSAFGPDQRVLTITEIARASGLPKSTVHRLVNRLIPLGAIEPHRHGYKLGLPMRRLSAAMPIEALRQSALPHLAKLHHFARRHVHLAQLRGGDVVFVERFMVLGDRLPSIAPGAVLPAHATALGKALLAHIPQGELDAVVAQPLAARTATTITDVTRLRSELDTVRECGIARAPGEARSEVACLAAPILGRGRSIGAVSVSLPNDDRTVDRTLADALLITARRIGHDTLRTVADGHDLWFPDPD